MMQHKSPITRVIITLGVFVVGIASGEDATVTGGAGMPVIGDPSALRTTLEDQQEVSVTVYNNDRALIRDRRKVKLAEGELRLAFMDVAQTILPETVSLRSLSHPDGLVILEQNYEYDLISPEKLMEKYVGKEVTLINRDNQLNFYEQPAKLLAVNGGPVYEVEGRIMLGHPGVVSMPKLPEELYARPTLVWALDSGAAEQEIEAAYLCSGMSWRSDYVLTLDAAETSVDIEGWVTMVNNSGVTFRNALLKVVAGDVNKVNEQMDMAAGMKSQERMLASAPMMQEESFAEYHLYTLPRRTTIRASQTKQVSLLSASGVGVRKVYEYRGNEAWFHSQVEPERKTNPAVVLELDNTEKNHLGIPLPEGIMRVYQPDASGALQFSGEDRIRHTPKDETVRLRLGRAFDIIGEKVQEDFQQTGPQSTEVTIRVSLRNSKKTPVTVQVIEPVWGTWEVLESSLPFTKKDAKTIAFAVDIAPESTADVRYRVRIHY
ncbi:MAG TPA: DUF4139 domain-containing protein [Candidatus Hydrogenedentes bacterium]|nr:DUF4139 domain-containing protein [Candidatus Hydrogenedentota bacterium]